MDKKWSFGDPMICPHCGKTMLSGEVGTGQSFLNIAWYPHNVRPSWMWPLPSGKGDVSAHARILNRVRLISLVYHPAWLCPACEMVIVDYSVRRTRREKGFLLKMAEFFLGD